MLTWPDDYAPAFDVAITVDERNIEQEPFQDPAEAAVYALQMTHFIDAAIGYSRFARENQDRQTAEHSEETAYHAIYRALSVARYAAGYTEDPLAHAAIKAITYAINMRAARLSPRTGRQNYLRSAWSTDQIVADLQIRQDAVRTMSYELDEPPDTVVATKLTAAMRAAWVRGAVSAAMENDDL